MRALIVAAVALLTVWQGGCLSVVNGALVNRCGLWQVASGRVIVVSLDPINAPTVVYQDRVIEHRVEVPKVIYQDRVIERQVQTPPVVIYRDVPDGRMRGITSTMTSGAVLSVW